MGETDNIQARLIEDLEGTNGLLAGALPTGFNFEIWSGHERAARQRQLILELDPAANRQRTRQGRSADREVPNSMRKAS